MLEVLGSGYLCSCGFCNIDFGVFVVRVLMIAVLIWVWYLVVLGVVGGLWLGGASSVWVLCYNGLWCCWCRALLSMGLPQGLFCGVGGLRFLLYMECGV